MGKYKKGELRSEKLYISMSRQSSSFLNSLQKALPFLGDASSPFWERVSRSSQEPKSVTQPQIIPENREKSWSWVPVTSNSPAAPQHLRLTAAPAWPDPPSHPPCLLLHLVVSPPGPIFRQTSPRANSGAPSQHIPPTELVHPTSTSACTNGRKSPHPNPKWVRAWAENADV